MKLYEKSNYENGLCRCIMASDAGGKYLMVKGGSMASEFQGEDFSLNGEPVKKCPLNVYNSRLVRDIFKFTVPKALGDSKFSFGAGDRLGLASPGHIRVLGKAGVFPILAQQSIRELNLTGRTYDDVLADAAWAALQEGYEKGYGADGDHLKSTDEVRMALEAGCTMITLDCSEHIGKSAERIEAFAHMEKYRGNRYEIGKGYVVEISDEVFSETMGIYGKALKFAVDLYQRLLADRQDVDFELSIDETDTPTRTEAHFLIAAWLRDSGVIVKNIAPRFCGEFQKGIDYRGNTRDFEKEFSVHAEIAGFFGHRLSVHSGSDKFSVFPIIGRETGLNCHVKTAGTNWLEALRCVAESEPDDFRSMYTHAVEVLNKAKTYYHIFTEKGMAPDINDISDSRLTSLLDIEESRQILHITYGFLLGDKDSSGNYIYRDRFFSIMHKNEELYYKHLETHIGNHLKSLGVRLPLG